LQQEALLKEKGMKDLPDKDDEIDFMIDPITGKKLTKKRIV
jgi:hypothetical protein